ncbi:MAG: alpha-mannosidase, partial [Fimbriimonadaceae bacterium]
MLKHSRLTFDRVRQFLKDDVAARIVVHEAPILAELDLGEGYFSVEPGYCWGPAYSPGRYRIKPRVPKEWAGLECGVCHGPATVWGTTETPCESTVFQDGEAIGGLDFAHPYLRLVEKAAGGERFKLELATYARNAETTVHGREKPRTELPQEFFGFRLLAVDAEMHALAHDVAFGISLAEVLGLDDPVGAPILRALNDVANQFRTDRRNNVGRCRKILREAIEAGGPRIAHQVTALGHAHLDTAWLWPLSVTRLKMAHTTAVQLSLIERYPDHVFVHSQASQYEWLEEEHPALFERVRKAAKRGQWEPLGSMWVEADCNLPSGESLVRQFLYGKRYFRERFGLDTKDMWLPDVFGYSAALPQILRKFGIHSFVTQKLSWNQFNKIPHHTFWWKGIDGTSVWAHFPPADTYTGDGTPKQIL